MPIRLWLAFLFVLPVMALAQITVVGGTRAHTSTAAHTTAPAAGATASGGGVSQAAPASGFALPGGFKPPEGIFDEFWNDPATAGQLHLTDAQRKQLQDAALEQRLSLIDSGAEALKSFLKLSALLEAEPFDDAAYQRQLSELSATTGKAVQNFGEMAATPRRVLSYEQWTKLQSLKKAKQAAAKAAQQPLTITPQPGTGRPK